MFLARIFEVSSMGRIPSAVDVVAFPKLSPRNAMLSWTIGKEGVQGIITLFDSIFGK